MRSLSTTPEANDDIFDAFRLYEGRRAGLGDEFLAELDRRTESIRSAPDQYESLGSGYCRAILGRFPYSIIFKSTDARVVVAQVPHHHRDDRVWKTRLGIR